MKKHPDFPGMASCSSAMEGERERILIDYRKPSPPGVGVLMGKLDLINGRNQRSQKLPGDIRKFLTAFQNAEAIVKNAREY